MRVLILDDEVDISTLVCEELERCGLTVTVTSTVAGGLRAVESADFDVAIIDVGLPDGSGLDVLREIRSRGASTHVLVLSGAVAESDRVSAFNLSADDYVVKPFYVTELCARVMAVTRKLISAGDSRVSFGDRLTIDLGAREVWMKGESIDLTDKEFDLLAFLATRSGHVFSRSELLRTVWVSEMEWRKDNAVAEHVSRLRRKIEDDHRHPEIIRTVRGAGYKFDPPGRPPKLATVISESSAIIHDGTRVLSADEAGARLFGCGVPEELIDLDLSQLVCPESLGALRFRIERLVSGAPVAPQLLEIIRTDGATLQVEISTSVTQWHGSRAWREVITPAASPSAQLLRLATGVVTYVPDSVIVTDLSGYVRGWNLASERVYGWDQEAAIGRHLADVVPWESGGTEFREAWATILECGMWHGEVHQLCRDRRVATTLASAREVLDDEGRRVAVVFTFRSSVHLPNEYMPEGSDAELADLRRGIERDEVVLHYQPLVDLHDGSIIGVEALARWQHPERGLLDPVSFLGIAERSGIIIDIGRVVRRKAMAQLARWHAEGFDVHVAINLSSRELADPGLVDSVSKSMVENRLPAGSVWFEVTETALVDEISVAGAALTGLVRAGACISIDDFGTGWGSLVYLRSFPIHALKVDRAFVVELPRSPEDVAITRSVVGLGAELGMSVIAEGIDSEAQRDALIVLGCRVGQGFLFGRPAPADEVSFESLELGAVRARPMDVEYGARGLQMRRRGDVRPLVPGAPAPRFVSESESISISESAFAEARHDLLWANSGAEVEDAAIRFVRALGGEVAFADDVGGRDALQLDLAFAGGPPLLAVADRDGIPRMLLERHLPLLVADAERAVALAHRTEALWHDAASDALTGIANRRYLDRAVERAHPGDAFVMIDLDHFKELNDNQGHLAGDNVLRHFGSMLRDEIRADDLAGRWGGEEFLLLLREQADAGAVCARLRSKWIQRRPTHVTFSAGWSHVRDEHSIRSALDLADRALYHAKDAGRDRALCWSPEAITT
jgi:diguanylate cyclase (GGDEF)-like protein/PAS domain S-box-containing protein